MKRGFYHEVTNMYLWCVPLCHSGYSALNFFPFPFCTRSNYENAFAIIEYSLEINSKVVKEMHISLAETSSSGGITERVRI